MTSRLRAAITGLGAVSGFGDGAELLWRALLEGKRAVRPSPALVTLGLEGVIAWRPGEDPLAPGDRATTHALVAAREAFEDARLPALDGDTLAVTFGTTLGAIGKWLDIQRSGAIGSDIDRRHARRASPAHAVAAAHGARGPVLVASTACASGNAALGLALDLVRSGRAKVVLAGGGDALNDFVIAGFASLKALDPAPCRPFDKDRRGLNLGEGACFLVVEEEGHARARGATIRGFLDGYGDAADANHMTGPDRDGAGAARAMVAALADAAAQPGEIDFVSAHGTATGFNDLMEAHALARVFDAAASQTARNDARASQPGFLDALASQAGKNDARASQNDARASNVPVNSIKGALGHTLGAAGVFEALMCIRTMEQSSIPPTVGLVERDPAIALDLVTGGPRAAVVRTALSTSSGFGGTNAAIVLRSAR